MTVTSEHPNARVAPIGADLVRNQASGVNTLAPPIHRSHSHRRLVSEGRMVFLLCFLLYLAIGILLDFHYRVFDLDATSRMANAFYVLYSRDPHIAAIGFVWNPGTSIADMVPLLFYHLWTPLASHMFSASLVSAAAMAGAVYQVRCTLTEWGVHAAPRITLVILLALNGMIVLYGGNGMSEGLYLFTLLATCRYLLRWLRDNQLSSLVYAAVALGLCYIVRNEAIGPAVLGGVVVLGVGLARNVGSGRSRMWAAMTDVVIFEIPVVMSFIGWAIASYVITGQPFQQFTSNYGTTSQIKLEGSAALKQRILQDIHDVLYLSPSILIVSIVAVLIATRRRDVGILAPIAVVGGALAFDLLAYINNSIQPWFRYFICAVPLESLLVGSFFVTLPALLNKPASSRRPLGARRQRLVAACFALTALVVIVPTNVTTILGMSKPKIGYEETQNLAFIFNKHPSASEAQAPHTYPAMQHIVDYFRQNVHSTGQVIVDNFSVCVPMMIAMSSNPTIFVIPNDRSYQRTLDDPLTFRAHYILDPDPVGLGSLATTNVQYPNLWKNGGGFTALVHKFPSSGACPEFRLFRVTRHPNPE
jgi:hypothetical protein